MSRQWLHYIVVNEEATKEGKIVMDYSGPNPPQGNHRCVKDSSYKAVHRLELTLRGADS